MPVGRQEIDACLVDVDRENAQTLNRIKKQQRPTLMSELRDGSRVIPPAGGIVDPAYGDETGAPVASLGQCVQRDAAVKTRNEARLDAAARQVLPGEAIRGKLTRG